MLVVVFSETDELMVACKCNIPLLTICRISCLPDSLKEKSDVMLN